MAVNSTTNRVSYVGDGATTAFPVSFPFHAQADLVIIETVIATGVQTVKSLTTHYTISGTTDGLGHYPNGGTVNAVVAPPSTVTWTIYRDPALTQGVDVTEGGPLAVESELESPLDRLTMIAQRNRDLVARSLRQPDGDTANISVLPSKVTRASKFLAFDTGGNPVATNAPDGATPIIPENIPDYSTPVTEMQISIDPGEVGTESQATSLAGELERLRFTIREFKQLFKSTIAQWYETIVGTITITNATIFSGNNTFQGYINYAEASGTDIYAATLSPAITAYITGAEYAIKFVNANTLLNATLNINSLGAKPIVRKNGNSLVRGDILANSHHIVRYDGTSMLLLDSGNAPMSGAESMRHKFFEDDFVGGTNTSGSLGELGWLSQVTGTATVAPGTIITEDTIGIIILSTGATVNSFATIKFGQGTTFSPDDSFDILYRFQIANLNNVSYNVGLMDTMGSLDPARGIYLQNKDPEANWFFVCRSGTETRVDSGVAKSLNMHTIRIRKLNSTTVAFSLDGGAEITINTNVPALGLSPSSVITNTSGSTRDLYLDYFSLLISGLSR